MSTPASVADAAHIQVLLVGIGHYPHLDGQDLPGTQGDLVIWHGLLNRMGIPSENMWLAASPVDSAAEEAQTVAHLLGTLPTGQVADGTVAGIRALVGAFVARLADPSSKADRALVFWAGHGYTAPDGSLHLATADTAATGGGPLQSGSDYQGLLAWSDLVDLLDQRPQSINLTLVVDTCFAAAGPGHRTLTQKAPTGRRAALQANRANDVVLSASLGGQQALEVGMHKLQVGAFSWAATCVLGRWGQSQQQAGMDISLNSLVARAGALLFAADIAQTPAFDGPADQGQRPFLHPPGDLQVGDSAPQRLPGSEISPGEDGRVYEVRVIGGPTPRPRMVSTLPTAALGGVPAKRLWWESMPATFTLEESNMSAPTSLPSTGLYESAGWASGSPPSSVADGGWEIQSTGSGDVDAWMYIHTDSATLKEQLRFVRLTSVTQDFGYGTRFNWKKPLAITSGAHQVANCHKK